MNGLLNYMGKTYSSIINSAKSPPCKFLIANLAKLWIIPWNLRFFVFHVSTAATTHVLSEKKKTSNLGLESFLTSKKAYICQRLTLGLIRGFCTSIFVTSFLDVIQLQRDVKSVRQILTTHATLVQVTRHLTILLFLLDHSG